MSELVIIRGLPGSGKTTLAKTYAQRGYYHCETDMYFQSDNGYKFCTDDLYRAAHSICYDFVTAALKLHRDVVVSNTFVLADDIKAYHHLAVKNIVACRVLKCCDSFGNIHAVPKDVLTKMKDRWEDYPGEFCVKLDVIPKEYCSNLKDKTGGIGLTEGIIKKGGTNPPTTVPRPAPPQAMSPGMNEDLIALDRLRSGIAAILNATGLFRTEVKDIGEIIRTMRSVSVMCNNLSEGRKYNDIGGKTND